MAGTPHSQSRVAKGVPVARVFVSHAAQQLDVAIHIAQYLERHHVETWYAARDIAPGESWPSAIQRAIEGSSAVLVLFSAEADASVQVNRELALADHHRLPIFWVRLTDVKPDQLGYFLMANQWFDWLDKRDAALEGLVTALRAQDGPTNSSPADRPVPQTPGPVGGKPAEGWPLLTAVLPNEALAATAAARFVFAACHEQMGGTLLLPTRSSGAKLFQAMLRVVDEFGPEPFGDAILTNDTETFGVTPRHPTSRTRQVISQLIEPMRDKGVAVPEDQVRLMSGIYLDDDPLESAQENLRRHPPFLHAMSLSPAGEIIGYEVGTYTDAEAVTNHQVRVIELGEAGKRYLEPNQPSNSIVTIGLGNCLSSEVILLLAYDHRKARIINQIVTQPETPGIPASLLRRHPRTVILTTQRLVDECSFDHFELFASAEECAARLRREFL